MHLARCDITEYIVERCFFQHKHIDSCTQFYQQNYVNPKTERPVLVKGIRFWTLQQIDFR